MEWATGLRAGAPALAILAPLLGAVIGLLGVQRAWAFAAVAATLALATAASIDLAARAFVGAPIGLDFGQASGAWRLEANAFNALALTGLNGLALLLAIARAARPKVERAGEALHFALLGFAAAMASIAALSVETVTSVMAVQAAALAAIASVALNDQLDRAGLRAAFEALVALAIAGTLAIVGAALVASVSGGAFWMISETPPAGSPRAFAAGLTLAIGGLALIAALAPLHPWFAPVWSRPGAGWLLLLPALASLVVAIRFAAAAFQTGDAQIPWLLCLLMSALGAASVVVGSVQALATIHAGRMMAFIVTAHMGFIALGFGLGVQAGAVAGVLHAMATAAALATLMCAWPLLGATGRLDGFGRRAPITAAAITAALLSLLGAPLTAGFAGKWLLGAAALERGWYWAAWLIALASLAAVVYSARLLERLWLKPSEDPRPPLSASALMAWAGGLTCVALGFDARFVETLATRAAGALMGMAP